MAETVRISVVLFSLHVLLAKWHFASTSIWKFSKTCQMTTTELSIEPINELESTSLDMKLRTFIFPRTWRNSSGWEMIISCLSLAHMRWRRLSIIYRSPRPKRRKSNELRHFDAFNRSIEMFTLLMSITSIVLFVELYRDFMFNDSDKPWHFSTVTRTSWTVNIISKVVSVRIPLIGWIMSNIIPKSLMSCQNVSTLFKTTREGWRKRWNVMWIIIFCAGAGWLCQHWHFLLIFSDFDMKDVNKFH